MNTRQSRIILFALLLVVGASQATAHGLTEYATQPVVEATTKAAASGVFNVDRDTLQSPPQKPTPWWWEWLRFAGGGR